MAWKVLLPRVIVEPSGRFANVPVMDVAAVLLITIKTMPGVRVVAPASAKRNCEPVLMVRPLAKTSSELAVSLFRSQR